LVDLEVIAIVADPLRPIRDATTSGKGDDVKRELVVGDDAVEAALQRLRKRVEMRVRGGVEDLEQRYLRGRHRQRVAVEGAHLRDTLVLDDGHDIGTAPDGAAWKATPNRLGERDQIGRDSEALRGPARRDGGARLHLVEDEQRAVVVSDVTLAGQVALVRQDDAYIHHRRFDDHRRDLARMASEGALGSLEIVERDHGCQLDNCRGYAFA